MESADQHVNPYAAPVATVAVPGEAMPQVRASRGLRLAPAVFRDERRGIHDDMADTIVVMA